MARRKTGRPRGRPRKHNARRRETTRAGRRGEPTVDRGSPELRRRRALATGDAELPADALGILLGHRKIDTAQYGAGREIGELLTTARRAFGGETPGNVWHRLMAGPPSPGISDAVMAAAGRAWRILSRLRRILGEPVAELVFAVAEGQMLPAVAAIAAGRRLTPADRTALRVVRDGLDRIARSWSTGTYREAG